MMMRPMAFGFDGVHNFDGSRISEVGQRQAPQLNLNLNQQVGNNEPTYTNMGGMAERMERERRRQAFQLNPDAFQQDRIGNYSLQRRNFAQLIPENQRVEPQPVQEISPIPQQNLQDIQEAIQDRQGAIAQVQPYTQSPFSFGLGSLGYSGFSPYGGGFSPFGMMGGYGGGFGGYGGMMGGFSPFGGYGGGYGGMMGGFSPFGGYGGFSPFGGGIYGGGIYNLPQAQQAPQQQTSQAIQQQANPFGDSIKQQYAQPVGQTTLFQ